MKRIGNVQSLCLVFLLLLFSGCAEDSGSTTSSINPPVSGSGEYTHVDKVGGEGAFLYTHDVGASSKDLYFIFTNNSSVSTSAAKVSSQGSEQVLAANMQMGISETPEIIDLEAYAREHGIGLRGTPAITEFNNNPPSFEQSNTNLSFNLEVPKLLFSATVGATDIFSHYDTDKNLLISIPATLRKISTDGTLSVNVWVADDSWDSCSKWYCMNQTMVDAYAEKFIQSGIDNDIYDWVTNIYGFPWGSHADTALIDGTASNQIDILFFDISNDGNLATNSEPKGGYLGFFWAKDNYKSSTVSYSNERLMFYMDSVLSAKPEDTWEITDEWPAEMVSTLAHEFQHMINFYQKNVLRTSNVSTETWLNEMASLITEDFLAKKLGINGPRGVDSSIGGAGSAGNTSGRIPTFNYYSNTGVTEWSGNLSNYSVNYAFGAYLARNFGGVQLFQKIIQNSYTDYKAIEQALTDLGYSLTFSQLLQKWSVAVLLSDQTDMAEGYRFNTGNYFTSTLNSIDYSLGSINFYNYLVNTSVGPRYYTESTLGSLSAHNKTSNTYVKMAESITGSYTKTIELPVNVSLTVVTK